MREKSIENKIILKKKKQQTKTKQQYLQYRPTFNFIKTVLQPSGQFYYHIHFLLNIC